MPRDTAGDRPDDYPARVQFRTDGSGGMIAVRPDSFLANPPAGADLGGALRQVWAESGGRRAEDYKEGLRYSQGETVRGDWGLYTVGRGEDGLTPDVLKVVRGLRSRGIPAELNHVYFGCSISASPNMFAPNMFAPNMFAPNMFAPNMFAGGGAAGCCCPGGVSDGETRPVPPLLARPVDDPGFAPASAQGGEQVAVHVVDIATPGPNLDPNFCVGEIVPGFLTAEAIDENADGWADPALAHGDFISSIIDLESGIKARLWSAADPLGDIDDAHLVMALQVVDQAAQADGIERRVLNLSLSGYNEDDRPSTVLADQVKAMIDAGWLIVAAAGNNASCRLAWPAALPGVVAVGAISRCAPAWFSNYGPWVDVSAPGVDVVARYPDLSTHPQYAGAKVGFEGDPNDPTSWHMLTLADFKTGWVKWSGTSFSAPRVAARLATWLQRNPNGLTDVRECNQDAIDNVINRPDVDWLPNYGRLLP